MIGLLALGSAAQAQTQVNGGFETWSSLTGTGVAPAGTPTGWTVSSASVGVTQVAGLTASSSYAAVVLSGTSGTGSSGSLAQVYSGTSRLTSYQMSFDLAVSSAATTATTRLAQVNLAQATTYKSLVSLAVYSKNGDASKAGLYVYDVVGTKWVSLLSGGIEGTAGDLSTSGTFNTTTDTFSNLNVYKFTITMNNFGTGMSYDISYGLEGGPTIFSTSTPLTYTYQTGGDATSGLYSTTFMGSWGGSTTATPYAVDNYVYGAIPEPTTMAALAMGALLLLGGRLMRRSHCS